MDAGDTAGARIGRTLRTAIGTTVRTAIGTAVGTTVVLAGDRATVRRAVALADRGGLNVLVIQRHAFSSS